MAEVLESQQNFRTVSKIGFSQKKLRKVKSKVNDPKQLLGIKGASETSSIWKLRIQLMKPITWIPLIWGVICGAAASGNFEWTFSNVLASLACMLMSGPLLAGYTPNHK